MRHSITFRALALLLALGPACNQQADSEGQKSWTAPSPKSSTVEGVLPTNATPTDPPATEPSPVIRSYAPRKLETGWTERRYGLPLETISASANGEGVVIVELFGGSKVLSHFTWERPQRRELTSVEARSALSEDIELVGDTVYYQDRVGGQIWKAATSGGAPSLLLDYRKWAAETTYGFTRAMAGMPMGVTKRGVEALMRGRGVSVFAEITDREEVRVSAVFKDYVSPIGRVGNARYFAMPKSDDEECIWEVRLTESPKKRKLMCTSGVVDRVVHRGFLYQAIANEQACNDEKIPCQTRVIQRSLEQPQRKKVVFRSAGRVRSLTAGDALVFFSVLTNDGFKVERFGGSPGIYAINAKGSVQAVTNHHDYVKDTYGDSVVAISRNLTSLSRYSPASPPGKESR